MTLLLLLLDGMFTSARCGWADRIGSHKTRRGECGVVRSACFYLTCLIAIYHSLVFLFSLSSSPPLDSNQCVWVCVRERSELHLGRGERNQQHDVQISSKQWGLSIQECDGAGDDTAHPPPPPSPDRNESGRKPWLDPSEAKVSLRFSRYQHFKCLQSVEDAARWRL